MRTVHLHGKLRKYAKTIDLEVSTAGEAVRALAVNFPEILADIKDGTWRVVRGDLKTGMDLGEEEIALMKLGKADLHLMPAVSGRKGSGGGVLKAVLGVALIAVSFGTAPFLGTAIMGGALGGATWGSALGMVGLSLALTGISSMLAPENTSEAEEKNSFILSGPTGAVGQGNPVPLVYGGPIIVGSVMISGGIDIDQLQPI